MNNFKMKFYSKILLFIQFIPYISIEIIRKDYFKTDPANFSVKYCVYHLKMYYQ